MAQVVECLPSKHKATSSTPPKNPTKQTKQTTKKKKKSPATSRLVKVEIETFRVQMQFDKPFSSLIKHNKTNLLNISCFGYI
jgi:hypothetical protein